MIKNKEDLTLADIESYREQAEKDIAIIINDFETNLGVEVSSIYLPFGKNKKIKLNLSL